MGSDITTTASEAPRRVHPTAASLPVGELLQAQAGNRGAAGDTISARVCIAITVHGRQGQLDAQLAHLDRTLDADIPADIIVYDDGSPVPIFLRPNRLRATLMRGDTNLGLVEARNRVLSRVVARYDCIMVLDDDIRLYNVTEAIRAGMILIERGVGVVSFPYIDLPLDRGARLAAFRRLLPAGPRSVPCFFAGCCMISSSVVRKFGLFEGAYRFGLEEEDYSLRLYAAGVPTCMLYGQRIIGIHDHAGDKERRERWVMLLSNRYLFYRKFVAITALAATLSSLYTLLYLVKTRSPSVVQDAIRRYRRERRNVVPRPMPLRVFAGFLLRRYVF